MHPYRLRSRCHTCREHLEVEACTLSWMGEPLCGGCAERQPAPDVGLARRVVGGPLASRRGHVALALHALGRAGALGAAGVTAGLLLLVSGADEARRGSLLLLSFGLLLMAMSFVQVEDAAFERWKRLFPPREVRRARQRLAERQNRLGA